MRGHVEIVKLLLERGADRGIANKQGKVRGPKAPYRLVGVV